MKVIYKITNTLTGKLYIGQSTNINKRVYVYKHAVRYLHSKMPIMHSIIKHGWNNFVIEIIDVASSISELNDKEKYWISFYNSNDRNIGYNIRSGGDNSIFPPDSKIKMSEAKIGLFIGENNPMYGKNHSDDTKLKISQKAKDRKTSGDKNPFFGKKHSEKSKSQMGAAVLDYNGTKNPNAKLNKEIADQIREDYKVVKSSIKLAKKYKVSKPTILDIINNKRWT